MEPRLERERERALIYYVHINSFNGVIKIIARG